MQKTLLMNLYKINSNKLIKLIKLIIINVSLTIIWEYISRSILVWGGFSVEFYNFFRPLKESNHYFAINHQALIQIWSTFFATLLGFPIFYLCSKIHRFGFFIALGVVLSILSQILVILTTIDYQWSFTRLGFDIMYAGSVKYFLFEYYRERIVVRDNTAKLFFVRGRQDFSTSLFRNLLLNILQIKG